MKPLRMAIVGAGYMGRLHTEKVLALSGEGEGVALCGVADLDASRARSLASSSGVPATLDYRELLPEADAAIVAVPTADHFSIVRELMLAGCDVLVEKPIAATVEEAEALMNLAETHGRILQVGHLEGFNAAIRVVRGRIRQPRFVEVHRMGPLPDRPTDIDVVRDLMIHDLDILQQLLGEDPCRIESVGVPVLTPNIDIANARLSYPGGCVANLTASRVSKRVMRRMRFFQQDAYFSVDFVKQSVSILRRKAAEGEMAVQVQAELLEVEQRDSLLDQLRAFVTAVRTRKQPALVGSGNGALGALRTAVRVVEAMPSFDDLE